ncbi:hypothetical protein THAOC_18203, partial [Thalassiosira oceanica]
PPEEDNANNNGGNNSASGSRDGSSVRSGRSSRSGSGAHSVRTGRSSGEAERERLESLVSVAGHVVRKLMSYDAPHPPPLSSSSLPPGGQLPDGSAPGDAEIPPKPSEVTADGVSVLESADGRAVGVTFDVVQNFDWDVDDDDGGGGGGLSPENAQDASSGGAGAGGGWAGRGRAEEARGGVRGARRAVLHALHGGRVDGARPPLEEAGGRGARRDGSGARGPGAGPAGPVGGTA